MGDETRTVGEVAALANVTVRTLHHYDEIGLLTPSGRSEAGYRLYGEDDLERLHHILVLRELDVPLEAIRRVLDDPGLDRLAALRRQLERLRDKAARIEAIIGAVEEAIETLEGGGRMQADDLFAGFDPAEYEEEVEERWGSTEAFAESARRTAGYTKEDQARIQAESEEVLDRLARCLDEGRRPDEKEVMDAAEAHRLHIRRWFYACSPEMHVALSRMWVDDPRFRATFEERREGLTEFAAAAVRANAARRGA